MNEIKILSIDGIDCYEKNGVAYLRLETVARGLGFTHKEVKNGKEYESIRWSVVKAYLDDLGFRQLVGETFSPEVGKDDFIPENIFYRLAMKAKNETAEKFQAKVADEIIPSIRKTGGYHQDKSKIEETAFLVKFIADDLRVNDASRLLMYENMCKDFDIPIGFLPKYEYNRSREMKAASHLLKENGCNISAAKFNQLLLSHGFLEEHQRPSSGGQIKKYKALTKRGLEYGENAVNPHNQKEVQPLYYGDKFMDLYGVVV